MSNLQLKTNYEDMARNAIESGVEYFRANAELKSMVIGVSGGIDSALTAVIGRRVCDILGNVRLSGYFLPMSGNLEDERTRAVEIGSDVCHNFKTVPGLDKAFIDLLNIVDGPLYAKAIVTPGELTVEDKIRMGNIKARIRMIYLYNQARKLNGLVLSTDNYTEYNLGFWSLNGDVGNLGLIQELWKTEVYGIAESIGGPLGSSVEAKPTDGLGITNSDLDQLLPGWVGSYRDGYREVDNILIDYLDGNKSYDPEHPVIKRHIATDFKRKDPVTIKRDLLVWSHN